MELSRVEIETRGRNSRKLLAYPSALGLVRNTQTPGSFDQVDEGDILLWAEWPKCDAEIENIILDSISRTYTQNAYNNLWWKLVMYDENRWCARNKAYQN